MSRNNAQTTRDVPARALRFAAGPFQFADDASAGADPIPVSLLARSKEPIDHWYWGRCVHDLAGMQIHKPRLTLDYCHDWDQVIGYLDEFKTTDEGLAANGKLTPLVADPSDRAWEIATKHRAGVPYEASINFDDQQTVIEEVAAGQSTEVNGRAFDGPLTIFRKWNLRGVAVCPYGYDKHTETALNADPDRNCKITILSPQEPAMSTETTPADQAAAGQQTPPPEKKPPATGQQTPPPEKPPADAPNPGQPFVDAFGQQGAVWFVEGKTFDQCATLHATALTARVDALVAENAEQRERLTAENTELRNRLAAIDRGEAEPVSSTPAGQQGSPAETPTRLCQVLGDKLGAFAGSIVIPGKTPAA